MYFLLAQPFFSDLQKNQIATALVVILLTIKEIAPLVSILIQAKVQKDVVHIKEKTEDTNGKVDTMSKRAPHRASDPAPVDAGNVPDLPKTNLEGHGL